MQSCTLCGYYLGLYWHDGLGPLCSVCFERLREPRYESCTSDGSEVEPGKGD